MPVRPKDARSSRGLGPAHWVAQAVADLDIAHSARPIRSGAVPIPSGSIARLRAPSGNCRAALAIAIRCSTPSTAGGACWHGRADRVTPLTTHGRRSTDRPASRWATRAAPSGTASGVNIVVYIRDPPGASGPVDFFRVSVCPCGSSVTGGGGQGRGASVADFAA
jgi:hypothetical protein